MDNYEYIIASLPVLVQGGSSGGGRTSADAVLSEIRERLSEKDNSVLDFVLPALDGSGLDADFYLKARASKSKFISEYFDFDLNMRNTKVAWLNKMLGRDADQDILTFPVDEDAIPGYEEEKEGFEELDEVNAVLNGGDLLARERGLDDISWRKVDEIVLYDLFSLDVILAFLVKLKIIDRWEKLDPDTGRELFRKLVGEIRSTYDNKKQNII